MRRLGLASIACCALVAACKGLLVDQGNDFPCDFSQPPSVRDAACAPGETCGVSNHCQRFVYEGPQFEGKPTFPDPTVGGKVHPLVLDSPVSAVAVLGYGRTRTAVATTAADGSQKLFFVDPPDVDGGPLPGSLGVLEQVAMVEDGGVYLLYRSPASGNASYVFDGGCVVGQNQNPDAGQCLPTSRSFRVGDEVAGLLRPLGGNNSAGQVDLFGTYFPFLLHPPSAPDAGSDGGVDAGPPPPVLDLQWVGRSAAFLDLPADGGAVPQVPVAFTNDGFWVRQYQDLADEQDSGWVNLLGEGEEPASGGVPAFFRRNANASVWGLGFNFFAADGGPALGCRLSTWLLGRALNNPGSMAFSRAWSDCVPCPKVGQSDGSFAVGLIIGVAAKHNGVPTVEVLCSTAGKVSLVEVLGSTAADVGQTCETRPLSLPFNPQRVAMRAQDPRLPMPIQDEASGFTVGVGGTEGEVWSGIAYSTALPVYLERVPTETGLFTLLDGGEAPVAVTDGYLAAQTSNNGFKTFRVSDNQGNAIQPRAGVGLAPGWFVDVSGRLLQLTPTDKSQPDLAYGPQLLNAHGQPASEPFFGEAVVSVLDHSLVSFVMAADDSLYLVPSPSAGSDPAAAPTVLPILSPEPTVPVRSFTLERTPIGTNGVDRVRGYLVTSRNVYEYELSGTPPRWSSTQLPLSSGEPLEVWMDNPRGGLGRVGYRDGTVLTLPGGFLLASAEPPLQVLDYENYGGWPVAYATSGLFVARWDYDDAAQTLLNKTDAGVPSLPMTWRRLALPDGGEPWMASVDGGAPAARSGHLQVVSEIDYSLPDGGLLPPGVSPASVDGGATLHSEQGFKLLLYLDDAVYEVGRMSRFNAHQVQPM